MTSTWELEFGLWLLNPAVTFGEVAQVCEFTPRVREFAPIAANPRGRCVNSPPELRIHSGCVH